MSPPKSRFSAPSRFTEPLPQQSLPLFAFSAFLVVLSLASGSQDATSGEFKRRKIPDKKGHLPPYSGQSLKAVEGEHCIWSFDSQLGP